MKDRLLWILLGMMVGGTVVFIAMKQELSTPPQYVEVSAPTVPPLPVAPPQPSPMLISTGPSKQVALPGSFTVKPGKPRQPDNHPGKLTFETKLMKLYAEPNVGYIPATFTFTNKSEQPITITKTKACCGSVVEELKKKTYLPGETGCLKTKLRQTHFQGTLTKTILMHTDEADIKPYELKLQIHVPTYIEASTGGVRWPIGSKPTPMTVEIKSVKPELPIKITKVIERGKGAFKTELTTLIEGQSYTFKVTPLDTSTPCFKRFYLKTDYPEKKPLELRVFARVYKTNMITSTKVKKK